MTRDALVEGLRARGHRSVVPLPGPAHLAEMVHAIARSGDFVVCLGAGNITQWAAALPKELAELAGAASRAREQDEDPAHRGRRMMPAGKSFPLLDQLPPLRGRVQADAPLGPTTWFRVGGPAEVLVRPADVEDLGAFLPRCRWRFPSPSSAPPPT